MMLDPSCSRRSTDLWFYENAYNPNLSKFLPSLKPSQRCPRQSSKFKVLTTAPRPSAQGASSLLSASSPLHPLPSSPSCVSFRWPPHCLWVSALWFPLPRLQLLPALSQVSTGALLMTLSTWKAIIPIFPASPCSCFIVFMTFLPTSIPHPSSHFPLPIGPHSNVIGI